MRFVGLVMRIFSFLFHIALTLFMLALSSLAWISSNESLQIGLLPWQGAALNRWLFLSGLAGLIVTLLAIKRILPVLFLIWSMLVLVVLVRGYFFTSYNFGLGGASIAEALYFVLAALVAAAGGWLQFRQKPAALERRSVLA